MNLIDLQTELRHFAAERDWQPFHTPKNLSTALMVEAAELAEIFQWMTSEESQVAHRAPATRQRIGEEVADVLLYLLQLADHSQIDIAKAVKDKLVRNAQKYPAKKSIARIKPETSAPATHVLVDYENVQPTEHELRALVPNASQVWVFHGQHQGPVGERFASFGSDLTAVPISRSGKNALDFHLSFYMGYIASRNQASQIVVVANDKGYEPMLEHAKGMGFAVCRKTHGAGRHVQAATRTPVKKAAAAPKPAAKETAAKPAPKKKAPAIKTAAGKASVPAVTKSAPEKKSAASQPSIKKMGESLRKMGEARPAKATSLRAALKSLLGAKAGDESIEVALRNLLTAGVVSLGENSKVSYPKFGPPGEKRPATA